MPARSVKEVKRIGHTLKPTVHVGKEGVTDKLIEEIALQIKTRKIVKVRLLPSAEGDREDIARSLAEGASAVLIDVVGHTVLLCDRRYMEGKGESKLSG